MSWLFAEKNELQLVYFLKRCQRVCITEMDLEYMPRLETIENCMKLSQMLIQAVDVQTSPLLQLPHITQDMLKHFTTKEVSSNNSILKWKVTTRFIQKCHAQTLTNKKVTAKAKQTYWRFDNKTLLIVS